MTYDILLPKNKISRLENCNNKKIYADFVVVKYR